MWSLKLISKVFCIFMNGSTDKGNVDNELMMVCWCDSNAEYEKLHTGIAFLAVDRPSTTNVEGLYELLRYGLQQFCISDMNKANRCHLIGIATNVTSVNIASGGLKM